MPPKSHPGLCSTLGWFFPPDNTFANFHILIQLSPSGAEPSPFVFTSTQRFGDLQHGERVQRKHQDAQGERLGELGLCAESEYFNGVTKHPTTMKKPQISDLGRDLDTTQHGRAAVTIISPLQTLS